MPVDPPQTKCITERAKAEAGNLTLLRPGEPAAGLRARLPKLAAPL
jgi:hypothetical protein